MKPDPLVMRLERSNVALTQPPETPVIPFPRLAPFGSRFVVTLPGMVTHVSPSSRLLEIGVIPVLLDIVPEAARERLGQPQGIDIRHTQRAPEIVPAPRVEAEGAGVRRAPDRAKPSAVQSASGASTESTEPRDS